MSKLRVFLVDDHKAFVDGMSVALPAHSNAIEVVGVAYSAEEALDIVKGVSSPIDIVITDFHMPGMNGIELGVQLKSLRNPPKVMLLTMFDAMELVMKANRHQLDGFAPKACSVAEIVSTAQEIHEGKFEFDYVSTINQTARLANNPVLTKSELQVLSYIVKDELSNADIAKEMKKSVYTIDSHRRNIGQKLGVHSVVGFVKYAYAIGML